MPMKFSRSISDNYGIQLFWHKWHSKSQLFIFLIQNWIRGHSLFDFIQSTSGLALKCSTFHSTLQMPKQFKMLVLRALSE